MSPLTAARAQMEVSLGFHMIFAALGIAMPLLMVVAEALWLRTRREHYLQLAKTWAKATALLFVIGAVSGTALSFELGLLWPRFMELAGGVIGPAFALEGFAFFLEAIFIGLYLYGWERLSPRAHLLTGIPVAVSGAASGVLVVAANAWMQVPVGFTVEGGRLSDVASGAVFRTPVWPIMSVHSISACYAAVGFAVAGVYAMGMLRGRRDSYHRSAITLAMTMAAVAAVVQIGSGDLSAKAVAEHEPIKLAAMEAHFESSERAPLLIGGMPDPETRAVRWALRVPGGLSFLAKGDFGARVEGLEHVPRADWPNVVIAHVAFQVMVGAGFLMAAIGTAYWIGRARRRGRDEPRSMLWMLVVGAPLGFIALEAGWVVTEVGRQPWAIQGVMRVRDAVTPRDDAWVTFVVFSILYLALGVALVGLLVHLARTRRAAAASVDDG